MTQTAAARIDYVWAILCAVTALSWWLGHRSAGVTAPVTIGVLALGLLKVRLIIQHFMEVEAAPTWLRRSTDGWLVVFWGTVLTLYLI